MTKRNLILIHRGPEYEKDFDEIAAKVNSIDRDISIYHLPADLNTELPTGAWQYPTLTVALMPEFSLPIRRGPVLKNYPIDKLDQQEIFRKNGIATPPALPFRFGMKLDPIVFGEFVILKPSDLALTSNGYGIHVFRRRRLESMRLLHLSAIHPIRSTPNDFIVQRFIHTGQHPASYRATTFLGKVMTLEKFQGIKPTPPLTAPDHEIERATFAPKENRTFWFVSDPEIINVAEEIARAFQDIPLLGIDIVKSTSGKLYALEVNAGGNTWHYSSKTWEQDRKANPHYYVRMRTQFGAFDIAATRLAQATHALAS
jgi:hypothetical protein